MKILVIRDKNYLKHLKRAHALRSLLKRSAKTDVRKEVRHG